MPLFIQGLMKSLSGCSPAARFLLEVVSGRASSGAHSDGPFRVKSVARQLCIPESEVSSAFGELVSAGVIERLASVPSGRGRPTISYQLSPSTLMALDAQLQPYGLHPAHLGLLFSGADIPTELLGRKPKNLKERVAVTKNQKPAPPGARSRLSICNRLLLGVLLANADQFGVVTALTSKDLRLLTGFDAESLKRRLQRLVGVGLIRNCVPGVTSSVFRAKRISSTYFLNLNHPGFGVTGDCAVMVHMVSESKAETDAVDVLWRDILAARTVSPVSPSETPVAVIHFLANERRSVIDVLRLIIYQCASELLSRHWVALAREGPVRYEWLCERIEAVLQCPVGFGAGKVKPDLEWTDVLSHFCKLVVRTASAYRTRFGVVNWVSFDSAAFSILPVSPDARERSIAMLLYPRPKELSVCTLLWEAGRGDVTPKSWGAEAEMPLDIRFHWGLMTVPARRLSRA